ncbi:MAG TPA: thioredoxin domain-containing protein [Terriglobales bacterium]
MKKTALLVMVSFASVALAQSTATKPTAALSSPATLASQAKPSGLPTQEQVEIALRRTLGYDSSLTWTIYDIRPSRIPDVTEILVALNKQQAIHVYWSAATQQAVVGDMIPFGPDPYAPIRAKLEAADGPARGPQQAVITMIDFSDLECPHCKAAQPVLEKLVTDFPQVRFVFQQFPLPASLHPWAMKAALYADCASRMDKDTFWKYVDTIFENQGAIALATADDQLKVFATAVGLDGQKVAACAATPEAQARVKKSMELGQSLDINETPTVFVNGRQVRSVGSIPYDQLKTLVQFEIDHAGK